MKTSEYIKKLNPTGYYLLDTKQNGLNNGNDINYDDLSYVSYPYKTNIYNKLIKGSIFLYRQTSSTSLNKKFYFFGGGFIKDIISTGDNGEVKAIISNGFKLTKPIYADDPQLNSVVWTTKKKKEKTWMHFFNQYGMNKITEEEFIQIIQGSNCVEVNNDDETIKTEIKEENISFDELKKKVEDFIGTYTKNGLEVKENYKNTKNAKVVGKKVDFDLINKKRKTEGTFGETLVLRDEKRKVSTYGIEKEVDHVALSVGDGLGYDILSYDEKGKEIYIEVKTTKANSIDNFYLSKREKEAAKNENYFIYRVYNLNMDKGTYNVEVFSSNELNTLFDLVPQSYIVKRKANF